MYVIKARNAQQALPEIMYNLRACGVQEPSRNGPVLRFPGPCTIQYERPLERVVFWPERDANPIFHVMESLWMLGGRNDVEFPARFVSRMRQFSDDGETFNGAYGYRWRKHFHTASGLPIDQIQTVALALKTNPKCRRQVMAMWDGHHDFGLQSKDLPCNTHIYFSVNHESRLDMMVCNRSNDIVWGALGANVVHMSILQEIMAALVGVEVGRYWQTSMNMHLYVDRHEELMHSMAEKAWPSNEMYDPYESSSIAPMPLVSEEEDAASFLGEVQMFLDHGPAIGIGSRFLRRVAGPMYWAHAAYKQQDQSRSVRFSNMRHELSRIKALDWRCASLDWTTRREEKAIEKEKTQPQEN